jgi:hypothetical protein
MIMAPLFLASCSPAPDTSGGSADDFAFPTEGSTILAVEQGTELQATFDSTEDAGSDDPQITQLSVTSNSADTEVSFDDDGRVTTAQSDTTTIDVSYVEGDRFEYTITSDSQARLTGSATLETFDESLLMSAREAGSRNTHTTDSLAIVVATCANDFRFDMASDARRECLISSGSPVDVCYAACLSDSDEVTELLTSMCVITQVRGQLAAEEESACLALNDRPESECKKLAQSSERVLVYLNLLYSTIQDVADSLRSQSSCPFGDITADNSECGNTRFNIIDECPHLRDEDEEQSTGDDDEDMLDDKDDPIVCDENSVPPDPDCFALINITNQGGVSASSQFSGDFGTGLAIDGNSSSSWFSDGDPDDDDDSEVYTWQFGENADVFLGGVQTDPEQFDGGGSFGFGSATVLVLDAAGGTVYNSGAMSLAGARVDLDISFPVGTVGRTVQLLLVGHQDTSCGGFAELRVFGFELITPEP